MKLVPLTRLCPMPFMKPRDAMLLAGAALSRRIITRE